MALFPPLTEESADPRQRDVIERVIAERGSLPDLMALLAHSPDGLTAYEGFARYVRTATAIEDSLRELLILRTVQLHGIDYEWKRHLTLARKAGVTEEQLRSLGQRREESGSFTSRAIQGLRFADRAALTGDSSSSAATELADFTPREKIDIIFIVGFYRLVSVAVAALDLAADDPLPDADIPLSAK